MLFCTNYNSHRDGEHATGFIGSIKLEGKLCTVLVTNKHVLKSEDDCKISSIKVLKQKNQTKLAGLMVDNSYRSSPEEKVSM